MTYSCREPYAPKLVASSPGYLVVEGLINTGQDSTIFILSRTVGVSSSQNTVPEQGAQVSIESASMVTYPLNEVSKGRYGAASLGLDSTQQYRLMIKTADGKQYLSEPVQSKPTPAIDSIGFTIQNNGIQVYVNTHDPKGATRYYRWDYEETWQFHAKYHSAYITTDSSIVPRTSAQDIYYCFTGDVSTSVTLGSSARLQQDVIYQQPITFIASTSEKIESRYSILLKQYALTQDAFNYWQNLKKNTEQLGTIFDSQPSELPGNVHCITNPSEPVIGYISAGSVQQKRIFIDNTQLPVSWQPTYPYNCHLDTNLFCYGRNCVNQVALNLIPVPPAEVPAYAIMQNGVIIGYLATTYECVDCTIRGTKQQPSFWINE